MHRRSQFIYLEDGKLKSGPGTISQHLEKRDTKMIAANLIKEVEAGN